MTQQLTTTVTIYIITIRKSLPFNDDLPLTPISGGQTGESASPPISRYLLYTLDLRVRP